ncbi:MAG TPA: hypothetical protein EYP29_02475 [Thermoplasmata archaeon]|nr:hypothetical protein [Thermoplasmata archaeon]
MIFYQKFFSLLSFFLGILFYFSWLAAFGLDKWHDPGVYSVTIVLVGFGAAGYFTYSMLEKTLDEK